MERALSMSKTLAWAIQVHQICCWIAQVLVGGAIKSWHEALFHFGYVFALHHFALKPSEAAWQPLLASALDFGEAWQTGQGYFPTDVTNVN